MFCDSTVGTLYNATRKIRWLPVLLSSAASPGFLFKNNLFAVFGGDFILLSLTTHVACELNIGGIATFNNALLRSLSLS